MPQKLVPPPPPITPSLAPMVPGADNDDMLAEEIFNSLPPPKQGAQGAQRDEADDILDSLPPPQQSQQAMPLPPPIPKAMAPAPQAKPKAQQPAAAPKPAVTRRPVPAAPPPGATPKQPPSVLQQAAGDVLKGVDNVVGQGLKAAQNVPILNSFMQQSQANSADVKRNPFEAAVATVAAAPAGALGFIDDLINIPAAQQGLGAPAHLREGYLGLPGVKRLTEAYPGAASTGEFGGAAAVPLGVPMGPLKAIKNPMVRGAVHGAVAGGAAGTVSAGGQQAKKGERPNLGKALREGGLPGAALGATAGVALGKLTPKSKSSAPGGNAPKTPNPSADAVTLKDGSTFTPDEAMKHVDNPATPEAVKREILEQLDARDQKLAGAAPEAKKEVHAEVVKPEEGLKPAQPAMPLEETKVADVEPLKPAEVVDYKTVPDDDLVRMMEDGDDAALTEYLERAPQNKTISDDAGAGELAPLQQAQEQAIAQPETASPATLPEGTTDGALNFSPEADTPQIAETKPAMTAGANLYQYRKTAKGYEVYNEATGDIAKKNWSEAKTKEYVDGLNQKLSENPEFSRSQGRRDGFSLFKKQSDYRKELEAGAEQTVSKDHRLSPVLNEVAQAKLKMDRAEAEANAYEDALREMAQLESGPLTKTAPGYSKELEQAAVEKAKLKKDPKLLGLEFTASHGSEGKVSLKPGTSIDEAFAKWQEKRTAYQESAKAYRSIRDSKVSEIRAAIDNQELPQTFNIDTGDGIVNSRLVPKGDAAKELAEQLPTRTTEVRRSVSEVNNYMKGRAAAAQADYQANANSTRPARAAKGVRSQRGAINLGLKKQHQRPTQQQPAPAAAAVAQGANKSPQIADYANDAAMLGRVFELRRSLDIARQRNATTHNAIWESIAKETLQGRGIKFKPEHETLINESLRMDPSEIRMGANGLNVLDAAQRNYLATRRTIRQTTGKAIKAEREAWLQQYGGNVDEMPTSVRHDYRVFQQLEEAFTGGSGKTDTGEFSELGGILTGAMYDYVFKWNPAYHALNLFDPLVVGSSRAGIQRIMAAKMVQQTDAQVRDFLNGVESKSPIDQLRSETRLKTAQTAAIKPTLYSKGKQAIANLQGKLPDLPSEKWNFNDSLAAGVIMRGDKIKHKGGGVQYLKDMAAGKLPQDEMIKGMVDALQVADDITGAGALGVNKDPVQRTPMMKFVTQFTSQPYRVARLLKQYAQAGEADKIATFLAMTALVSGRAALPKETDILKFLADKNTRKVIYAVEDMLDAVNIIDDVPVIGRDLTDKMRYSLVPVLGGLQTNMVIDNIAENLKNLAGKKFDKIGEAIVWQSLSALLGGGGLEMGRIKRESENAQEGDKKVYAPHPLPYGEARPDKSTFRKISGRAYNTGDALGNMVLPGRSPIEGAYVKKAQRKRLDK